MLTAVTGCNSDEDTITTEIQIPVSAEVLGFKLSAASTVITNMDSVFFSIDQLNLRIFNADSLPVGTNVTRMVPSISVSSASIIELHVKRAGLTDTVYNYIDNSTDSIDFTNPVELRIVSYDGLSSARYTINVNVHKTNPDTLMWSSLDERGLPSSLGSVTNMGAARNKDTFHCLTTDGTDYCMATATDPSGEWSYSTPQLGFKPKVETLSATEDALFMLSDANALMTSADNGKTWTSTGQTWQTIYGGHENQLLGLALTDGRNQLVTWPATTAVDAPVDFPLSGTSQAITYAVEMSDQPQTLIVGGRLADGSLSRDTWGYDGSRWIKVSQIGFPHGFEDMTVFPYYVVNLNKTNWTTNNESVLVAIQGRADADTLSTQVYMSADMGMHWGVGDDILFSAQSMPARVGARAFMYKKTMYAQSRGNIADVWRTIIAERNAVISRAIKPISEWECPYVYIFGGRDVNGALENAVYRGVINRFTFKPIQ